MSYQWVVGWEIFYVNRAAASRTNDDVIDTVDRLDRLALPDGTPVVLDGAMRPVEPVCGWMRALAYERKQPETMRAYAYVVRRLGEFLAGRGCDLVSATEADLVAYRRARTEVGERPVGEATWSREAVVINLLYGYLLERGLVRRRPFRLTGRGRGRNPLGGGVRRDVQVRHMTVEQYLYFRDVGLGGQLSAGGVDAAFRGWHPHRGRAALELALLTGMRLQEWSTVLLPELGLDAAGLREPVEFELQACAKYEMPRRVYVPAAALAMIDTYLLLERAEAVEASARTLARDRADLFVVDRVDTERGRLSGTLDGRRRSVRMSAMSPQLRRITVRECGHGLEPLAVFIGRGGRMLGPSSWDRVRIDAWHRMQRHAGEPGAPMLPARPWRFHDARHTFALQLLKHLQHVRLRQHAACGSGRELVKLAEHISLNPLLTVQRCLGHRSPASTYVYLRYLEDTAALIDAAFAGWSAHDGATYAEIALRSWEIDRQGVADAPKG